jgi:hypothetical protein
MPLPLLLLQLQCRYSGFVQSSKLICKEIALQRPKTGKFDYLSAPGHSAHSMASEFFTDDEKSSSAKIGLTSSFRSARE